LEVLTPERIDEMRKIMDKMNMNTDIEAIKSLMANYENATLEQKLNILEDLDYYMHQFDNAQDFVSIGGLDLIIVPGLTSLDTSEDLVAKSAILLGSAAQHNIKVQVIFF
jgi:nucleotide exchange factor SIL1